VREREREKEREREREREKEKREYIKDEGSFSFLHTIFISLSLCCFKYDVDNRMMELNMF
jgi:hypothetical protein